MQLYPRLFTVDYFNVKSTTENPSETLKRNPKCCYLQNQTAQV